MERIETHVAYAKLPVTGVVVGEMTTDNARSSYGLPVFVFNGRVYGPADIVDGKITLGLDIDRFSDLAAYTEFEARIKRAGYAVK